VIDSKSTLILIHVTLGTVGRMLMTAQQTASRLGVKLPTIYAYVSRGTLDRVIAADGTSRFDSRHVERLARRGKPRLSSQVSSINLLIESGLTFLTESELRYRSHAVKSLIRTRTFEEVAKYLWTGQLEQRNTPWASRGFPVIEARADQLIRIICAQLPTSFEGWAAPQAAEVVSTGELLIASIVDALPQHGTRVKIPLTIGDRSIRQSVAARLWPKLTTVPATSAWLQTLNTALILMADHELATSTFAVRVAASTHASPSAAVLAGLGAMQGPLHGGASRLARELLLDAERLGAEAAIGSRLERRERLAGFGHRVYVGTDPRATLLLREINRAAPGNRSLTVAHDLVDVAARRIRKDANIDLALAAFERVADMASGSAETIFTVARISGWLGHALEEYGEAPLRFRVRAQFTG
jgi:citrate synthase